MIIGKEVYGDGQLKDQANSAISNFIYVYGAKNIYIKNLPIDTNAETAKYYFFYDQDKQPIGTYHTLLKTVSNATISVESGAYYFCISTYQRFSDNALPADCSRIMITTEYTDEEFIPTEKIITSIKDYNIKSNKNTKLSNIYGLKVLIFGDSITETARMDDDGANYTEGTRHNWPEYVNQYMQWKSFNNYAKSGAAYKYRGSSGYEYRQTVANQIYLAMQNSDNDDVDIVIFSLGTNDGAGNLGDYTTAMSKATLQDLDQTKLYEALRYAYWSIRDKYKNAICFSALPIQRANNEQPDVLIEAIEKMAKRYNFIIIDATHESGIIKENNTWEQDDTDLYDGLHPNTNGQIKMAKLYTNVIVRNLLYKLL